MQRKHLYAFMSAFTVTIVLMMIVVFPIFHKQDEIVEADSVLKKNWSG